MITVVLFIAAFLALDVLAWRFGVDSRETSGWGRTDRLDGRPDFLPGPRMTA
jgi:hypothetical protein